LPEILLVTKAGCHLCEAAEQVLHQVCEELGLTFEKQFIENNPELAHQYQEEVPVVLINRVQHSAWRVDAAKLRAALSK
jgi:glutaredoxin